MNEFENNARRLEIVKQDASIWISYYASSAQFQRKSRSLLIKTIITRLQYQVSKMKENDQNLEAFLRFLDSRKLNTNAEVGKLQAAKNDLHSKFPKSKKWAVIKQNPKGWPLQWNVPVQFAFFQDMNIVFHSLQTSHLQFLPLAVVTFYFLLLLNYHMDLNTKS